MLCLQASIECPPFRLTIVSTAATAAAAAATAATPVAQAARHACQPGPAQHHKDRKSGCGGIICAVYAVAPAAAFPCQVSTCWCLSHKFPANDANPSNPAFNPSAFLSIGFAGF